jgi:hypothetical protein
LDSRHVRRQGSRMTTWITYHRIRRIVTRASHVSPTGDSAYSDQALSREDDERHVEPPMQPCPACGLRWYTREAAARCCAKENT